MSDSSKVGLGLVVRVAAIQTFLLAFCWAALGIANARGTWLLAPAQSARAAELFRLPLPLLGLFGTVLIPVLLTWKLVREASQPGLLDREFVDEAFKLPSRAARCGLVISVVAFNVAAFVLRRSIAIPPIEAAKIASLGLVVGTLLSVLSYFALLPAVRALIA